MATTTFWIFAVGVLACSLCPLVEANCQLPANLLGAFTDSVKGDLYYNGSTIYNFPLHTFGTLTLTCYQQNGTIYIFESTPFFFFSLWFTAYYCWEIIEVNPDLYYYYELGAPLAGAGNEKVKALLPSFSRVYSDICPNTNPGWGTYRLIYRNQTLIKSITDCPEEFQFYHNISITHPEGNETCVNNFNSLEVCTNSTTLTFNSSDCSIDFSYSDQSYAYCLLSINDTANGIYYMTTYNDGPVDGVTTYETTCMIFNYSDPTTISGIQYPGQCPDDASSSNIVSPGAYITLINAGSCIPPGEEFPWWLIGVGAGAFLFLVLIILLICCCCCGKKGDKDKENLLDEEDGRYDPRGERGEKPPFHSITIMDGVERKNKKGILLDEEEEVEERRTDEEKVSRAKEKKAQAQQKRLEKRKRVWTVDEDGNSKKVWKDERDSPDSGVTADIFAEDQLDGGEGSSERQASGKSREEEPEDDLAFAKKHGRKEIRSAEELKEKGDRDATSAKTGKKMKELANARRSASIRSRTARSRGRSGAARSEGGERSWGSSEGDFEEVDLREIEENKFNEEKERESQDGDAVLAVAGTSQVIEKGTKGGNAKKSKETDQKEVKVKDGEETKETKGKVVEGEKEAEGKTEETKDVTGKGKEDKVAKGKVGKEEKGAKGKVGKEENDAKGKGGKGENDAKGKVGKEENDAKGTVGKKENDAKGKGGKEEVTKKQAGKKEKEVEVGEGVKGKDMKQGKQAVGIVAAVAVVADKKDEKDKKKGQEKDKGQPDKDQKKANSMVAPTSTSADDKRKISKTQETAPQKEAASDGKETEIFVAPVPVGKDKDKKKTGEEKDKRNIEPVETVEISENVLTTTETPRVPEEKEKAPGKKDKKVKKYAAMAEEKEKDLDTDGEDKPSKVLKREKSAKSVRLSSPSHSERHAPETKFERQPSADGSERQHSAARSERQASAKSSTATSEKEQPSISSAMDVPPLGPRREQSIVLDMERTKSNIDTHSDEKSPGQNDRTMGVLDELVETARSVHDPRGDEMKGAEEPGVDGGAAPVVAKGKKKGKKKKVSENKEEKTEKALEDEEKEDEESKPLDSPKQAGLKRISVSEALPKDSKKMEISSEEDEDDKEEEEAPKPRRPPKPKGFTFPEDDLQTRKTFKTTSEILNAKPKGKKKRRNKKTGPTESSGVPDRTNAAFGFLLGRPSTKQSDKPPKAKTGDQETNTEKTLPPVRGAPLTILDISKKSSGQQCREKTPAKEDDVDGEGSPMASGRRSKSDRPSAGPSRRASEVDKRHQLHLMTTLMSLSEQPESRASTAQTRRSKSQDPQSARTPNEADLHLVSIDDSPGNGTPEELRTARQEFVVAGQAPAQHMYKQSRQGSASRSRPLTRTASDRRPPHLESTRTAFTNEQSEESEHTRFVRFKEGVLKTLEDIDQDKMDAILHPGVKRYAQDGPQRGEPSYKSMNALQRIHGKKRRQIWPEVQLELPPVRGAFGQEQQQEQADDPMLKRLLEELYKDKKYLDKTLVKETAVDPTDAFVKHRAEEGRDYLLNRAKFWSTQQPLQRPGTTAVGHRVGTAYGSTRSEPGVMPHKERDKKF